MTIISRLNLSRIFRPKLNITLDVLETKLCSILDKTYFEDGHSAHINYAALPPCIVININETLSQYNFIARTLCLYTDNLLNDFKGC